MIHTPAPHRASVFGFWVELSAVVEAGLRIISQRELFKADDHRSIAIIWSHGSGETNHRALAPRIRAGEQGGQSPTRAKEVIV